MKKSEYRYWIILSANPYVWMKNWKGYYWDSQDNIFYSPQYTIEQVNEELAHFRSIARISHFTKNFLSIKQSNTPFIGVVNVNFFIGDNVMKENLLNSIKATSEID